MKIYKHIPSGMFLKLIRKRESNINTYLDCDELGDVIYKVRAWAMSKRKHKQERLVKGFKNLIEL